jgi:ketosteroid isomerase-like protein
MPTSRNRETVERYLDGFRRTDHAQNLSCLTDDIIMAELTGRVPQHDGSVQRLSMAEVFRLRDGLVCERRAWVIPLQQDDVR